MPNRIVLASALLLAASSAASDGSAATPSSSGVVSREVVDRCAGFTVEKAASVLGVEASALTDYSRTEGKLRYCFYRHSSDRAKSVSFTLSRKDSVDGAKRSMARERESAGQAQGSIDKATGSKTKEAAVDDVSSVGDEAFFANVNKSIVTRVGNVIAIVMAPQDMGLKKRVAEAVVQGMRP